MTAILHHAAIPIASVTSSSAAPGYPAANVLLPAVALAWRSTSAVAQTLDIDLGASYNAPTLCLAGLTAARVRIEWGAASVAENSSGYIDVPRDASGVRRVSRPLAKPTRYVRVSLSPIEAAPDDGADYYAIGALYVFAQTLTLPDDPLLGSEAGVAWPQTRIDLPNGTAIAVDRGTPRQVLSLRFRSPRSADVAQLVRLCRRSICWLDLQHPTARALQWPVRHVADTMPRTLARPEQDDITVELREAV